MYIYILVLREGIPVGSSNSNNIKLLTKVMGNWY